MAIDYKDPVKNVTPRGRIRFYRGFGMDPSYSNSLYFPNKEAQDNFYASHASSTITYNNGSTEAPNMAIKSPYTRTFVIPANSAELFDYNYMQVTPEVGESGVMGKPLYMFITGVSYVNENSVLVTAELDVIQTFMFDWYIGSQRVERMHSPIIYDRYAEELKLDEPYDISINEIVKTEKWEVALNTIGYLLVVTDFPSKIGPSGMPYSKSTSAVPGDNETVWYGYSSSSGTLSFASAVPKMGRDSNQLIYVVVNPGSSAAEVEGRLRRLLDQYNYNEMMSAIKGLYCIPSMCTGQSSSPNYILTDGYKTVVPGVRYQQLNFDVPVDVNGYLPIDPKTYNLLRCRISQRDGSQFVLGPHEINTEEISLLQEGICTTAPSVITTIGTTEDGPFISSQDGSAKTYNPPSMVMSAFPSGCVFNSDAIDAFELQFLNRQINTLIGVL